MARSRGGELRRLLSRLFSCARGTKTRGAPSTFRSASATSEEVEANGVPLHCQQTADGNPVVLQFPGVLGEPLHFNIVNSTGIQIGSYNHLEIKDQSLPSTPPAHIHNNHETYRELFESTDPVPDTHLNIVRRNLGKHWKDCARKLGFSDPELDEIDHDYEWDGLREKVYQMFQRWLVREGSKGATVGKLASALHACHRIDLLNSLVKINMESEMDKK